jgi:hypothetical protein
MTIIEFSKLLAECSPVILSAGLITGCINYKKFAPLHKAIMVYLAMMLVTDVLCDYVGHKYGNNFIILHIYSFAELAFMIYLYQKMLFRKRHTTLLIMGIMALLYIITEILVLYVFNSIVVKDFQPYAKVVDNFMIILMAFAYLQERISRYREIEWGNFRLNMAFLVYFTINTLFFVPLNFLINAGTDVKFYFWTGHVALLLLLYLYLSLKLLKAPQYKVIA